MIPKSVGDRIANYYFQRYFPDNIREEIEDKLIPYYLEDEEPPEDEMVKLAITIIDSTLKRD